MPVLPSSGHSTVVPASPQPASLPRIASLVFRSALLPGTGHLATGHRRWGRVILAVALVVLAAGVATAVVAVVSPATAASYTVRPRWLWALRWGSIVLAVAWVVVILRSAVLARPGSRGTAGRLVAGGLALVLAVAVAVPAAFVTHYADVQLAFVQDVFHDSTPMAGGAVAQAPSALARKGRLNVLLVGSDAGPDRTGVRTDTLVLASLDTRTGRSVLFTLPRNLERVPFAPGSVMAREFPRGFVCGGDCLLNAVYGWGADHPMLFPGDPDPGMTALRSAVSEILGLTIDYDAFVDLAGFSALVDALGGVTIRVERRLPIGGLDADGNQVRPSGHIEPGLQRMDGEKALAYARSRSDSSDYERVQRQRCLLGALQRQADPGTLLTNFQQLATSTADALQTDIPRSLLPDLVKLAFKVKEQPILSLTFTPPLIDTNRPDFAAIRGYVQAALVPAPSPSPTIDGPTTGGPTAAPTTPAPGAPAPGPSASPPAGATTGPAPVSVDDVCSYS
ncbi:MAG TPA: LCP family protein [Mycobacteriales bacterium]|nr:LCP family protein [Mycobacteriales bacterium]